MRAYGIRAAKNSVRGFASWRLSFFVVNRRNPKKKDGMHESFGDMKCGCGAVRGHRHGCSGEPPKAIAAQRLPVMVLTLGKTQSTSV